MSRQKVLQDPETLNEQQPNIFDELQAAVDLLRIHYLSPTDKEIDEVQMARHGLAAMLTVLGDPFTNYIPPPQLDSYKSRKVETMVGIGLQVEFDKNNIARIISPLLQGPSDIAGIECGNKLLKVNGHEVEGGDIRRLNHLLNGPEGSEAVLTVAAIERSDSDASELSIPRGTVNVDHMRFTVIDKDVLLARVAWFSGTGYSNFIEKVEHYISKGVKSLILDLRSNSGGSIISTRNIFSSLCEQEIMYYGMNAKKESIRDRQLGEHRFNLPLMVLINEATFSAGEVLCGALQDYKRATVVGSNSGGKGSMQQIFPLEGLIGGAMRITTATNCTPTGNIVQGNGITPDIAIAQKFPELFVDDGPQNIHDQGRALLKQLRYEKLCATHGEATVMPVWQQGDQQLAAAVDALKGAGDEIKSEPEC